MKQKRLNYLALALIVVFILACTYAFFLGLQYLFTLLLTSIDGVQTNGKVVERVDGRSCNYGSKLNIIDNDACSYIVTKYEAINDKEYILGGTVYTSAITENEITIIYNPNFPTIAYFDSNLGKMTFDLILYLIVSPLLLRMIYKEIPNIIRKWNKDKRSDKHR